MYLKIDLIILVLAIVWFFIGINVVRNTPLIHGSMVTVSRFRPWVAPLIFFILVVFWPLSKLLWKFFYCILRLNRLKHIK
jgi:hypothetical protein